MIEEGGDVMKRPTIWLLMAAIVLMFSGCELFSISDFYGSPYDVEVGVLSEEEEPVVGAVVYVDGKPAGVTTNAQGQAVVRELKKDVRITVEKMGWEFPEGGLAVSRTSEAILISGVRLTDTYEVSVEVLDGSGGGVFGVQVTFVREGSTDELLVGFTDSDGLVNIAGIPEVGTLTFRKTGWEFEPNPVGIRPDLTDIKVTAEAVVDE